MTATAVVPGSQGPLTGPAAEVLRCGVSDLHRGLGQRTGGPPQPLGTYRRYGSPDDVSAQIGLISVSQLMVGEELLKASQVECLFVSRGRAGAFGRRLVARPGSGLAEEPVAGV